MGFMYDGAVCRDGGLGVQGISEGGRLMQTVILCGGKGTRAREETEFRPKPLVDIGGRPIIWHIMQLYAHFGQSDFVLCLGHKGSMIKEYFLSYDSLSRDASFALTGRKREDIVYHNPGDVDRFDMILADTGIDTLTGGRIKRVERYIEGDTFMVAYGDVVSDVDIDSLLAFHRAHGKIATVTAIQPTSRFGTLDISSDGVIERFREKPQTEEWVSGGFFVFNRGVFDYLDANSALEDEPLANLAADDQLMAYRHRGFWHAMDTYRDTLHLNELWTSGAAPWAVWKAEPVRTRAR